MSNKPTNFYADIIKKLFEKHRDSYSDDDIRDWTIHSEKDPLRQMLTSLTEIVSYDIALKEELSFRENRIIQTAAEKQLQEEALIAYHYNANKIVFQKNRNNFSDETIRHWYVNSLENENRISLSREEKIAYDRALVEEIRSRQISIYTIL